MEETVSIEPAEDSSSGQLTSGGPLRLRIDRG